MASTIGPSSPVRPRHSHSASQSPRPLPHHDHGFCTQRSLLRLVLRAEWLRPCRCQSCLQLSSTPSLTSILCPHSEGLSPLFQELILNYIRSGKINDLTTIPMGAGIERVSGGLHGTEPCEGETFRLPCTDPRDTIDRVDRYSVFTGGEYGTFMFGPTSPQYLVVDLGQVRELETIGAVFDAPTEFGQAVDSFAVFVSLDGVALSRCQGRQSMILILYLSLHWTPLLRLDISHSFLVTAWGHSAATGLGFMRCML